MLRRKNYFSGSGSMRIITILHTLLTGLYIITGCFPALRAETDNSQVYKITSSVNTPQSKDTCLLNKRVFLYTDRTPFYKNSHTNTKLTTRQITQDVSQALQGEVSFFEVFAPQNDVRICRWEKLPENKPDRRAYTKVSAEEFTVYVWTRSDYLATPSVRHKAKVKYFQGGWNYTSSDSCEYSRIHIDTENRIVLDIIDGKCKTKAGRLECEDPSGWEDTSYIGGKFYYQNGMIVGKFDRFYGQKRNLKQGVKLKDSVKFNFYRCGQNVICRQKSGAIYQRADE